MKRLILAGALPCALTLAGSARLVATPLDGNSRTAKFKVGRR
jgi:hypothetical protein